MSLDDTLLYVYKPVIQACVGQTAVSSSQTPTIDGIDIFCIGRAVSDALYFTVEAIGIPSFSFVEERKAAVRGRVIVQRKCEGHALTLIHWQSAEICTTIKDKQNYLFKM